MNNQLNCKKLNYEIEMIINKNLYEKKLITENLYKEAEIKLLKLCKRRLEQNE